MSNKSRRTPPQRHSPAVGAQKPRQAREVHVAPLLIVGTLVGLGLGIWLLGIVWPVDDIPETALVYGGASGLFSGMLGAGAVAGSLVMARGWARWLSPIAGALFAAGFTGLVLASMGSDSAPWALIGILGIGACVVWFYVLGMISGYIPPLFVNRYGTWAAPVGGVVLIIIGVVNGSLEGLALGVLTIAAWVGIFVGSVIKRGGFRQAQSPAPVVEPAPAVKPAPAVEPVETPTSDS